MTLSLRDRTAAPVPPHAPAGLWVVALAALCPGPPGPSTVPLARLPAQLLGPSCLLPEGPFISSVLDTASQVMIPSLRRGHVCRSSVRTRVSHTRPCPSVLPALQALCPVSSRPLWAAGGAGRFSSWYLCTDRGVGGPRTGLRGAEPAALSVHGKGRQLFRFKVFL